MSLVSGSMYDICSHVGYGRFPFVLRRAKWARAFAICVLSARHRHDKPGQIVLQGFGLTPTNGKERNRYWGFCESPAVLPQPGMRDYVLVDPRDVPDSWWREIVGVFRPGMDHTKLILWGDQGGYDVSGECRRPFSDAGASAVGFAGMVGNGISKLRALADVAG